MLNIMSMTTAIIPQFINSYVIVVPTLAYYYTPAYYTLCYAAVL